MRQFALLAAVAFAVSSAANAQIVTKYSGIQPAEHPASYTEDYFAQELASLTKGSIKVEVYHNTQLGDAVANVQSIRNGTVGFSTVSTANLNQVIPAMDMYSLPFLFKNEAHFWWFLAQPEAAALAKPLEDKGIKIIAYIDSGARNFFAQKAIRSPDDMKGEKIRVMASPVMINTMKALGATGVPVAWAELYTALQTGVVDGAENNHPSVVAKKFYEVSKYYTLDEHMRIPDVMIMSMKLWNRAQRRSEESHSRSRTACPSLYARRVARVGGEGSPRAQGQVHRDRHAGQNAVREGCFRNGERRSEAARRREDDRLHSRLAKELLKAHRVHCIRAAAIRRHYVKGRKP